jgi:hypothetical protein
VALPISGADVAVSLIPELESERMPDRAKWCGIDQQAIDK